MARRLWKAEDEVQITISKDELEHLTKLVRSAAYGPKGIHDLRKWAIFLAAIENPRIDDGYEFNVLGDR